MDLPKGFEVVSTPEAAQEIPEGFEVDQNFFQKIDQALQKVPGIPQLTEFAAATNRSVADIIDFIGPDTINAALQVSGSEMRVPTLRGSLEKTGIEGGFVEPGLQREVIQAAGETIPAAVSIGTALRSAAGQLPAFTAASEGTLPGVLRQMGQTTAAQDVSLGAAAGVGSELGREIGGEPGAFLGSLLAPVAAVTSARPITQAFKEGGQKLANFLSGTANATANMSEEGAVKLIGDALVREGISPNDAMLRLKELGPEAIPADLGTSFTRLLAAASAKNPRIMGNQSEFFKVRQQRQPQRIIDAFDDASGTSGLSLDDEITRLNQIFKPEIDNLYAQARQADYSVLGIEKLMANSPTLAAARKKAGTTLKDMEAMGKKITGIDVVDQTKRELDNAIGKAMRQGEKARAMHLVQLKNALVSEADQAVPAYKAARDVFAGKMSLQEAGNMGEMFFKLNASDVQSAIKTMGDSELKLFKLGVKNAFLDKIEGLQTNTDAVKRLFGRRGDIQKTRALFRNEEDFNRFASALERESQFILTRNLAQKTSGTPERLLDAQKGEDALNQIAGIIENPGLLKRTLSMVLGGLRAKKGTDEAAEAWKTAGDLLLEKGIDPDKLHSILRRGSSEAMENELRNIFNIEDLAVPAAVIQASVAEKI